MLGVRLRGFPAWFAARATTVAMPGVARRLRLVIDWTVGLFFGRASADPLGQLGDPPLHPDGRAGRPRSARMTGERIFREGRPGDLRATFELTAVSLREAVRRRGVPPVDEAPKPTSSRRSGSASARCSSSSRASPTATSGSARRRAGPWAVRVARFDPMDELSELAVDPERMGTASAGGSWSESGRDVAAWWSRSAPPDLSLYTRFGVMPRALAPARRHGAVHGAAVAGDGRHGAGRARAHGGTAPWRSGSGRAAGHRAQASRAPRVLWSHASRASR